MINSFIFYHRGTQGSNAISLFFSVTHRRCVLRGFILSLVLFAVFGCSGKYVEKAGMYEPDGMQAMRSSYEEASFDEGLAGGGEFLSAPAAAGRKTDVAAPAQANAPSQAENPAVNVSRKLIKIASISIEADPSYIDSEGKLSGVNQRVDELMKKYGAYSENTKSEENSSRFTIRVPQIYYESLIAEAGSLGKVRSRTETAEDVTIKYYDLEGRLNTKKQLLSTFQGYLSRAKDIDDIMKVETRIADLQNEIDWLGNQLTRLGNLVDYATVELNVYTYRYTTSYTLGDRIAEMFSSYGEFLSTILVVIIGIVIFAGPILIVGLLTFMLLFGRVGILKKAFRYVFRKKEV